MGRKDTRQKRHQQKKADGKLKKTQKKTSENNTKHTSKVVSVISHSSDLKTDDSQHMNLSPEFEFLSQFYPSSWLRTLMKVDIKIIIHVLKTYFPIIRSEHRKSNNSVNSFRDINTIANKYKVDPDILGISVVNYQVTFKTRCLLTKLIANDYSPDLDDFIIHIIWEKYCSFDESRFDIDFDQLDLSGRHGIHLLRQLTDKLLPRCSLYMVKNLEYILDCMRVDYNIEISSPYLILNNNIEIFRYLAHGDNCIVIGDDRDEKKRKLSFHNINNIIETFDVYYNTITRGKEDYTTILDFLIEELKIHVEFERKLFAIKKSDESDFDSDDHYRVADADDVTNSQITDPQVKASSQDRYKHDRSVNLLINTICSSGLPRHIDYILTKVEFNRLQSVNMNNLIYLASIYPEETKEMFLDYHATFLFNGVDCNLEQLETLLSHLNIPMNFILEYKYYEETVNYNSEGVLLETPPSAEHILKYDKSFFSKKKTIFDYLNMISDKSKYYSSRISVVDALIEKYFSLKYDASNDEKASKLSMFISCNVDGNNVVKVPYKSTKYQNTVLQEYLINTLISKSFRNKKYFEYLYMRLVCSFVICTRRDITNLIFDFTSEQQEHILQYFHFQSSKKEDGQIITSMEDNLLYFQLSSLIKMLCSDKLYYKSTNDNIQYKYMVNNFIACLINAFCGSNIIEGVVGELYFRIPKNKTNILSKGEYNSWALSNSNLYCYSTSGDENNEDNEFTYHKLPLVNIKKKIMKMYTLKIMNNGDVNLYEQFSYYVDPKMTSEKSFCFNKNKDILNKYVRYQESDYDQKKKEIKRVLKPYSQYITYKFNEVEIENHKLITRMYGPIHEYGPIARDINYTLVFELLNFNFTEFFNKKHSLGEYDLYNLLFCETKEGGQDNEEETFELLKLLSEKFVTLQLTRQQYEGYSNNNITESYFAILMKVCFRLQNIKYIRYLKSEYESEFRKHFKEEYLSYSTNIELFEELEKEKYFKFEQILLWNYLSCMDDKIFNYYHSHKDHVKQSIVIKFLEYLIFKRCGVEMGIVYVKAFMDNKCTSGHTPMKSFFSIMSYLNFLIV